MSVYSLKSPLSSADFTIYAPGIGTLSYTVSSPLGRIQHLRTLLQLYSQSLQFSFLVPPGTHHCWVDRGGRDMRGLPNTSTHDCQCGHVLSLCESCSRTTPPCLQYPTSSVVYAMSTRAAPHDMALLCSGWEPNAGLLRDSQVV